MTVFQAYCNDVDNPNLWRFVLTFPNPSVADQWWRAISDTPSLAGLMMRINPQFYTHNANSFNIKDFFTDSRTEQFASEFVGKLFMTLIDDLAGRDIPVIRSVHVANAISGNWFFLRSTADSSLYWHFHPLNPGQNLTLSATQRTAFRISAVDEAVAGKVLVDTDLVTLQIEWTDFHVNVSSNKDLLADVDAHQFLFGDLRNKTGHVPAYGLLKDKSDSSTYTGWKWELVE